VVAAVQETDQLTSFVVQTILTVDDFLMFKAMMVRRNIDLTNQVLEAVEQMRIESSAGSKSKGGKGSSGGGAGVAGSGPSITSQAAANSEEAGALKDAMDLSTRLAAEWSEADRLRGAMRALQLEDEEEALPAAIAASLREAAKYDTELADIAQAGMQAVVDGAG
ncbi:hypothetical protein TSOC_009724, partial [Tetrabaena socialis]